MGEDRPIILNSVTSFMAVYKTHQANPVQQIHVALVSCFESFQCSAVKVTDAK